MDVNGINKLAAEMYYTLYHRVHGMKTVSLRLTNTYGPRMDLRSNSKGFVGIFVRRALEGAKIRVYGTGQQKRDFNYVDDVVEALLRAGSTTAVLGKVYNLGHPNPRSLLDFVETRSRTGRIRVRDRPVPGRGEGDRHRRLLRRLRQVPRGDRLGAGRRSGRGARAHARLLSPFRSAGPVTVAYFDYRPAYFKHKREIDSAIARVLASGRLILGAEGEAWRRSSPNTRARSMGSA